MANKLQLKQVLGKTAFYGNGDPTGIFYNENRSRMALASRYDLYSWEGREIGATRRLLRYRVSLYDTTNWNRLGVLDSWYPVNDISFHPLEPVIAVSTGSYDGGYIYDGKLMIWDYVLNQSHSVFEESRKVVSARFNERGDELTFILSPRDDEEERNYKCNFHYCTGKFMTGLSLKDLKPVGTSEMKRMVPTIRERKQIKERLTEELIQLSADYEYRSNAWCVKWVNQDELIVSGEAPYLEKWTEGSREKVYHLYARGVQLFLSTNHDRIYLNSEEMELHPEFQMEFPVSYFASFKLSSLDPIHKHKLVLPFALNQNKEGLFFLKSCADQDRPSKDMLFNHEIQIVEEWPAEHISQVVQTDEQKDFYYWFKEQNQKFIVKRNPDTQVEQTYSLVEPKSLIQEDYKISPDQVQVRGEEYIVSARIFHPQDFDWSTTKGIIYSMTLTGETNWIYHLDGHVIALCYTNQTDTMVFSTSTGQIGILSAKTGELIDIQDVWIDHGRSMILSLDTYENRIVAGTVDGLVLIYNYEVK
ncbi:hypothetical protein [Ammoniphilus sp. CFH 90114]|uniref:hypothetical protein n=1 Tax=Ammoniphilus sp. CFH 90114 TaxID=2493665 RepID=UPI00100FDEF4|nr:hypothetical protein [Ammoniphilus sp. CFH 90114]RXT01951.1 hypothetical protein EIZ39_25270 [Ammoniphilus sp. CFH 90114]